MKPIKTTSLGLVLVGLLACQTAEVRTMGLRHTIRHDGFEYLVRLLEVRPWADSAPYLAAVPYSDWRIGRSGWATYGRRSASFYRMNGRGRAYGNQPAAQKQMATERGLPEAESVGPFFGKTEYTALGFQVPASTRSAYRLVCGTLRLCDPIESN